jgi:FkbM family methyltransferase
MSEFRLNTISWIARLLPDSIKRTLYNMGPISEMVRGGLNQLAPEGLTTVTVAAGCLEGIRISLDLKSEKDMWLGTYETELQQTIIDYVNQGMTVYDIGANIGFVSLLLSKTVGAAGRVISFEAFPENIERLRENIRINHFTSNVEIVPKAVVEKEREVKFMVGPSGGMGKVEGSTGRDNIKYNGVISVSGISIDGFVYEHGNAAPDVLKIDIEGGEIMALPGMQRVITQWKPVVLLEVHGPEAADAVWDCFRPAGYHLLQMETGYPPILSVEELGWKSYLVAVP